jgi:hypothetical protein
VCSWQSSSGSSCGESCTTQGRERRSLLTRAVCKERLSFFPLSPLHMSMHPPPSQSRCDGSVLFTTHLSPCISATGMYAHTADYGWRTTWDQLFEPNGCQPCLYARSISLALCLLKQQSVTFVHTLYLHQSHILVLVLVGTHECSPSHV